MKKKIVLLIALILAFAVPLGVTCCKKFQVYAQEDTDDSDYDKNISKTITQENNQFTVGLSYGIDGYAFYDKPAQISIKVTSEANFSGKIRVVSVPSDSYVFATAYEQSISLAAGTANTFKFSVSSMEEGNLKVQILDEDDEIIYEEKDLCSLKYGGSTLAVGVLSDDFVSLNYMDGIKVSIGSFSGLTELCKLSVDNFPDSAEGLNMMAFIIIDNYDTSKLSAKQYAALKEWVNNGGVLICSLGANYQNVLHIFSDSFLQGSIGELTRSNLNIEYYLDGESQKMVIEDTDILSFDLTGGSPMNMDGTSYKKKTGAGAVVALSYALSMEPVNSFSDRENLTGILLQEAATSGTEMITSGGYQSSDAYTYITENILESYTADSTPNTVVFVVIMLIYVVLVGPVLYLVLKKLNKRQYLWLGITVTALVFIGIIYIFGLKYKMSQPVSDSFSIITLDEDTATEDITTSIVCPRATDYKLRLKSDYYNVSAVNDYYEDDTSGKIGAIISDDGNGTSIKINNYQIFNNTMYTMKNSGENQIGTIDTDLHYYTDGFEGTVTNNTCYDMYNVVVEFGNCSYEVGELKKGETVSIDKADVVNIYSSSGAGYNSYVYYYYDDINDETIRYSWINNLIRSEYISDSDNQGAVWGMIDGYTSSVFASGVAENSNNGVLITRLQGSFEDIAGAYYRDISEVIASSDGDYDEYDGEIYSDEVIVNYQFESDDNIDTLINMNYGTQPYNYDENEEYAQVYALNLETGTYDQIFTDSDTLSGSQLDKYMSGGNITLKYTLAEYTNTFMPTLSAEGGSK